MVFKLFTRNFISCLKGLITTFALGLFMLLVGVIPDLDHVLILEIKGLPITWENLATQSGRPLHIVGLVVVVSITCVVIAYINRLWVYK